MTSGSHWQENAACGGVAPGAFFPASLRDQLRVIATYCDRCPVRDPCLADALDAPAREDHGVRGGTTRTQRDRIRRDPDLPTGRDPVTIAALRQLLDEEQPDVPRHPAPRTPRRAARAAKETPMPTTPAPVPAAESTETQAAAGQLPDVGDLAELLAWADGHTDGAIRKHATRARESLAALAQRSAADAELERIHRERAELEARLAELNARAQRIAELERQLGIRDGP